MSSPKILFGFHAVGVRLKTAPQSIVEIYFETTRRDARMRQFIERAQEAGVRLIEADSMRLAKLAGSHTKVLLRGLKLCRRLTLWMICWIKFKDHPCCWSWMASPILTIWVLAFELPTVQEHTP